MKAVEALHLEAFRLGRDWFPIRFEMVKYRGRVGGIHPVRHNPWPDARKRPYCAGGLGAERLSNLFHRRCFRRSRFVEIDAAHVPDLGVCGSEGINTIDEDGW